MRFEVQKTIFFDEIRSILQQARQNAYTAVNSAMVEAYLILRVEKRSAREYYIAKAVGQNWSTHQLERNINSLLQVQVRCYAPISRSSPQALRAHPTL